MNCLFSCCFNEPVIETTINQPLTNSSIITMVDKLEETILEKVVEPIIDNAIQKITGQDISGVIGIFIKKELEPAIECLLNNELDNGLLIAEKIARPIITPIIQEVETNIVPIMNQVEIISPQLKNEIENAKTVLTDVSTLLSCNDYIDEKEKQN